MQQTNNKPWLRMHVLSDLHLSMHGLELPEVDADITVLAGDITRPAAAMQWAARIPRPVLFVPGNHEFYGGAIDQVRAQLQHEADKNSVQLLDEQACVINGVRILGATLWSDFDLFGVAQREQAMAQAQSMIRDFQVIRNADASIFAPADARALFAQQYAWLQRELAKPHPGPTVVITHHAPCPKSVHQRFADSPLSAAFVSDCTALMGQAQLWIHGHTHDSFDYVQNGTRVVCNPRGYFIRGANENPDFDPGFCVDVDAELARA